MCYPSGFVIFWTTKYHTPSYSFPDKVLKRFNRLLCHERAFYTNKLSNALSSQPRTFYSPNSFSFLHQFCVRIADCSQQDFITYVIPTALPSVGLFFSWFPETISALLRRKQGKLVVLELTNLLTGDSLSLLSLYPSQDTISVKPLDFIFKDHEYFYFILTQTIQMFT